MNNKDFGWEALLRSDAPNGSVLKSALLTTYDRPDERLLVEHLLPAWLKLEREPQTEGKERQYFLLELDARLKQLHGRIVIVSSTLHEEAQEEDASGNSAYAWIWRSVRHLTVGSQGKAIQHAKLWLLHWCASDGSDVEHLEIVVSSANLTNSAFRSQLQAAWRVCLPLAARSTKALRASWGVLPEFLRCMARSTGKSDNLDTYIDLLARAECPARVQFLASVPGRHNASDLRRNAWGAAGLSGIVPPGRGRVSASILSPYIGAWEPASLKAWCDNLSGHLSRIRLVWIDTRHPWREKWVLPERTLNALAQSDAVLLHLRFSAEDNCAADRFNAKHHIADLRWSHAKLYYLCRGNSRRLLLTSANFSQSAWGRVDTKGVLEIDNFELGVCIEQADWPFDKLSPFTDTNEIATTAQLTARPTTSILWATASWDGQTVTVLCRCAYRGELTATFRCGDLNIALDSWQPDEHDGTMLLASSPWTDIDRQPSVARLACRDHLTNVPVFDDRPFVQREASLPDGVDAESAELMRDALLFERYGGLVADDLDTDDEVNLVSSSEDQLDSELTALVSGGRDDSYDVTAFVSARTHLQIVDNWVVRMNQCGNRETRTFEQQIMCRDAALLVQALHRQSERDSRANPANALGSHMAAEELALRLSYFSQEE